MTKEELMLLSDEQLILRYKELEFLRNEAKNNEQGIKLLINSVYGAFGNQYFLLYNRDIAESITLQGQDVINKSNEFINLYFNKYWHKDTKLHNALNLRNVKPINEEMILYNDTDSAYVWFDPVLKSCEYDIDPLQLIMKIGNLRLSKFLNDKFTKYALERGCIENLLDFEMETISWSGLFLAKKKYILDLAWKEPNIFYKKYENIKYVGGESRKSDIPLFSRDKYKEFVKFIFKNFETLKRDDIIAELQKYKELFKIQNIDDISIKKNIKNYEKYVTNDTNINKKLSFMLRTPFHIKSAALYNYIINKNGLKNKYKLLKSGDSCKIYYIDNENAFAYPNGEFPEDIAPLMDFDVQFEKTFITPINRVLTSLNLDEVDSKKLFILKTIF